MDFRNFTTHAAERRCAGAILGTPPPVDGNGPACITAHQLGWRKSDEWHIENFFKP